MPNDIPPKQTLSGMPQSPGAAPYEPSPDPLAGGLPQHGLVIHDSSPGDAGGFPVLKAFQDYLEMERQQARKRLVTLTIFFVSLMSLVVAGFIVAFVLLFGSMSKREDRLLEAAMRPPAAEPAAHPAVLAAQQAARDFQDAAKNLQTNLHAQLEDVGAAATRLDSKVEAQNAEMAKLRDALAAMQKENEKLRTDMPKLAVEAARKVPPVEAAPAPRPPAAVAKTLPATATAGTPAASTGHALRGYDEAVLLIRSRDSDNTIPWRAFVPK